MKSTSESAVAIIVVCSRPNKFRIDFKISDDWRTDVCRSLLSLCVRRCTVHVHFTIAVEIKVVHCKEKKNRTFAIGNLKITHDGSRIARIRHHRHRRLLCVCQRATTKTATNSSRWDWKLSVKSSQSVDCVVCADEQEKKIENKNCETTSQSHARISKWTTYFAKMFIFYHDWCWFISQKIKFKKTTIFSSKSRHHHHRRSSVDS